MKTATHPHRTLPFAAALLAASLSLVAAAAPREDGKADRPKQSGGERREARKKAQPAENYTLAQATSDQAQLHTLAFDGVAFLTSTYEDCTFLPPGKVCDYFGFQYLRDIDAATLGHNTDFLTRISNAQLLILDEAQRSKLLALARQQAPAFSELARLRLPLVSAFCRLRDHDLPPGATGLDDNAVLKASAAVWELDGRLSLERATVFAEIALSLTPAQREQLATLKFGDSRTWPEAENPPDTRGLERPVKVAYMTYASELYSWLAGGEDADVYFCPERHATYFGSFYIKDAPVMGKRNTSISTTLTGDAGAGFIELLSPRQKEAVTSLVDQQRQDLARIVEIRRAISRCLRGLPEGAATAPATIARLSAEYAACDGRISLAYARAFALVARSLTDTQRATLAKLRGHDMHATGPHEYSKVVDIPRPDTDALFAGAHTQGR